MLRILNHAEEAIISLLLLATTLLVFADVVMRFGFGTGFMWTQELTLLMSAWFVLFGASYGIKVGSHIGMDAFVRLFPPVGRRILTGIACLLALTYCGLILYGSFIYLKKMKQIGIFLEDMDVMAWQAHSILLIGFGLITFRLLIVLYDVATGKADGFKHSDEAKESMEIVSELKREGSK
ncbi:TRAP transporter small permease [Desulfopila inferna]|uniref:TRAP transporter small permease n=1 Tax=Desulfopila inferna TaxID=468528 RepID=UPI001965DF10|nr:TRAP transporter small permease [Desulfopila inferna]MBM9602793.1 TRAP transporter small permease [Desulfopila inferna]